MPDHDAPPLRDHMHTHLQHLPRILHPGKPPAWVPDDMICHDTGEAYHYTQPLRTMAHLWGGLAISTRMNRLQPELHTPLYFSALDPSLLPVHLQK